MKRKILILFVVLLSLFTLACGKSEGEKSGILDTLKNEENVAQKNLDKYNSYIDLNNLLIDTTAIEIFDNEYLNKIFKEDGNFRKLDKKSLQDFGEEGKRHFLLLENHLNEVKKHINDKPKYDFDPEVEKLIDTIFKLEETVFSIIDYYRNGEFEKDNYKKAKELDDKYLELLNNYYENSGVFFDHIEKLEYENNQVFMKELEKKGQMGLLSMVKFGDTANRFSDLLYDRQDFVFSDKDLAELKVLNQELEQDFKNLEAVTDKQLESEALDKNIFKNYFTKNAADLIKYTKAIIDSIEKKRNLDNDLDGFDRAHSGVVDAYNSII